MLLPAPVAAESSVSSRSHLTRRQLSHRCRNAYLRDQQNLDTELHEHDLDKEEAEKLTSCC